MPQEQLKPLVGKIDRIYGEGGIQPKLHFSISVNNKNDAAFDLLSIRADLYVEFMQSADMSPSQIGRYLGNLIMQIFPTSPSISPGENNPWDLYLPLPLPLFSELEQAREGHNLSFQISASYVALERSAEGQAGRTLSTELTRSQPGSLTALTYQVAKSQWEDDLKALGYARELGETRQNITKFLGNIAEAKRQAEQWASDAKIASMVTAENALAKVHAAEESKLRKSAWPWFAATIAAAAAIGTLISIFLQHSWGSQFGVPQAILRVGALAVLGYVFAACFRLYRSYKHLELISRHRANIGQTLAALLTAQPSPEAKNVLAGIAAHQMMSFGGISLTGKESDDHEISALIEFLKNLPEYKKT